MKEINKTAILWTMLIIMVVGIIGQILGIIADVAGPAIVICGILGVILFTFVFNKVKNILVYMKIIEQLRAEALQERIKEQELKNRFK